MKNKKIRIFIIVLILIILAYIGYTKYANVDNIEASNEITITNIGNLNVSEFKQELENGNKILIDIRTQEELDSIGTIRQDVLNIDFYGSNFVDNLNKLDKSKEYLIYCRSGNRTKSALNIMKKEGFKHVKDLNGGINAWTNSGEKVFK